PSIARRKHRLTLVRARSDRCAAGRRLRVLRLIHRIGTTVTGSSTVWVCPSRASRAANPCRGARRGWGEARVGRPRRRALTHPSWEGGQPVAQPARLFPLAGLSRRRLGSERPLLTPGES